MVISVERNTLCTCIHVYTAVHNTDHMDNAHVITPNIPMYALHWCFLPFLVPYIYKHVSMLLDMTLAYIYYMNTLLTRKALTIFSFPVKTLLFSRMQTTFSDFRRWCAPCGIVIYVYIESSIKLECDIGRPRPVLDEKVQLSVEPCTMAGNRDLVSLYVLYRQILNRHRFGTLPAYS